MAKKKRANVTAKPKEPEDPRRYKVIDSVSRKAIYPGPGTDLVKAKQLISMLRDETEIVCLNPEDAPELH